MLSSARDRQSPRRSRSEPRVPAKRSGRNRPMPRLHRAACCTLALSLIYAAEGDATPLEGKAPQSVQDQFIPDPPGVSVETWISGLSVPWSLVFVPDGRALVSERRGQIRLIEANGQLASRPFA